MEIFIIILLIPITISLIGITIKLNSILYELRAIKMHLYQNLHLKNSLNRIIKDTTPPMVEINSKPE